MLNISKIIEYSVLKMKYEVIFIPHAPQDVKIISKIFDLKTISKLRNNIAIAPLFYSDLNLNIIYNLYKNSEINICSRLHSNIISIISKNNHTIGLSFLKRIYYLSKSIKNEKNVIDIHDISLKNFKSHFKKLKNKENKKIYKMINIKKKETFLIYKKYLNQILNS